MDKSLYYSLKEYANNDMSSFHTPGHKGVGDLDLTYDITEIDGFESLYGGTGVLRQTEEKLSDFLDTTSIMSAGGSTLCIQTMISLCAKLGDTVIVMRGVHQSVINTFALLNITPYWIFPKLNQTTGLALMPTKEDVEEGIVSCPQSKNLLITSPDYYGQNADIAGISEVCKKHGITLMVDSAHGAHYPMLKPNLFPINLGADICCASLHKTLPVMTGGAALSFNNKFSIEKAKIAMNIFGSSSPSYGIMVSIDKMLNYGKAKLSLEYSVLADKIEKLRKLAMKNGFIIPFDKSDPTRLTLGFATIGYTKAEIKAQLNTYKIEPEYIDEDYLVLITTPNNSEKDLSRLEAFINSIKPTDSRKVTVIDVPKPFAKESIRNAMFKTSQVIPLSHSVGRIAGSSISPCPPGIPLVIPGEIMDEETVAVLKKVGIINVNVI